ncbi:hypothetical protein GCM10020331_090010 [Ectobacillus funiculus]
MALTDCATYVDEEGHAYPAWKNLLDTEYNHLLKRVRRTVNVKDYGARGDGRTDDTEAFKKAIGSGRVKVYIPAGVFVTKGLQLPSWTYLEGAGKGTTIIKLHHAAPKGTRLITNANYRRGNRNIYIQGMTLDWNVERLGYEQKNSYRRQSLQLPYICPCYLWLDKGCIRVESWITLLRYLLSCL